MKADYSQLTGEELEREKKKLHRKLIAPNIAILIIALIAAISLAAGAWISVKVPVNEDLVVSVFDSMSEGTDGESGGTEGFSEEQLRFLFKDVNTEIAISLTMRDMLDAGFAADDSGVRAVIENSISGAMDTVETLAEQMMPSMVAIVAAEAVKEAGLGELDYAEIDTSGFEQTIQQLNAQDAEGAKATFLASCEQLAQEQLNITLSDEDKSAISDSFDEAVDLMRDETGTISTSNLLTNLGEGENAPDIPTTDELLDKIPADTMNLLQTAFKAAGIAAVVCAGLWALLALLALLHIFLKNKKVGMWYVKLTGLFPFAICWLAPTLALKFLPQIVSEMPALPAIAFGGLTFISALCLLALWIVSIFWCHPIKKRIRRCKDEISLRGRAAR